MNEKEQKKRRFVVHLVDQPRALGVVCNDYNWGVLGVVFQGSKVVESCNRYTVFGALPTTIEAFHELTDDQEWPDYVGRIYAEGTTLDIGTEQDIDEDQDLAHVIDVIADELIANEEGNE